MKTVTFEDYEKLREVFYKTELKRYAKFVGWDSKPSFHIFVQCDCRNEVYVNNILHVNNIHNAKIIKTGKNNERNSLYT